MLEKWINTFRVLDLALTPEDGREERRDEAVKLIESLKEQTGAMGWPLFIAERESRPVEDPLWAAFHVAEGQPPPALTLVQHLPDNSRESQAVLDAALAMDFAALYTLHAAFPAAWGLTTPLISAKFAGRVGEWGEEVKNEIEKVGSTFTTVLWVGGIVVVGGAALYFAGRMRR